MLNNQNSLLNGEYAGFGNSLMESSSFLEKENTHKTYMAHQVAFFKFCDSQYHQTPIDSRYTVTEDKVRTINQAFAYIFYQAHRAPKKQGRKKKNDEAAAQGSGLFDADEFRRFDLLIRLYHDSNSAERSHTSALNSTNVCGYSVVNAAYEAINDLRRKQVDRGSCNLTPAQLRTERIVRILRLAQNRKAHIRKQNYAEKVGRDVHPWQLIEEVPRIARELFLRHSNNIRRFQSSLRDRFIFLMSNFAIMRGI